MKIEAARYEKGELHLRCSPPDGVKFCHSFKPGDYDLVSAVKKGKPRSRNANNYAWALINKISEQIGEPPMDVYVHAVRDAGVLCAEPEEVPIGKLPAYIQKFVGDHLGRQVRTCQSYDPRYVTVIRIFGSSDYDVHHMARFIDSLTQDAIALDIEVRDPGYVQSLLDAWEARR